VVVVHCLSPSRLCNHLDIVESYFFFFIIIIDNPEDLMYDLKDDPRAVVVVDYFVDLKHDCFPFVVRSL
jgi:hypothetical protein